MPQITEFLQAIERRAERAVVQELRLMTQEILSMRTHLTLDHRAHADALLLKLDHLERCQRVETSVPTDAGLSFDPIEPLQPSHYLVHFYSHEVGDLERVELTETLAAAAQLVREHLNERPRPLWQVKHCATRGALSFLTGDDIVLASIVPCEPSSPMVEPRVAQACAAFTSGDAASLHRLFASAMPSAERMAA